MHLTIYFHYFSLSPHQQLFAAQFYHFYLEQFLGTLYQWPFFSCLDTSIKIGGWKSDYVGTTLVDTAFFVISFLLSLVTNENNASSLISLSETFWQNSSTITNKD